MKSSLPSKRSGWYSHYQRDVIGPLNTHWARENGMADNSRDQISPIKEEDVWPTQTKPMDRGILNRDNQLESEEWKSKAEYNIYKNDGEHENRFLLNLGNYSENRSKSEDRALRHLSMSDLTEDSEIDLRSLPRALSLCADWSDVYEEYKPPKRYQKPADKLKHPNASRVFISGISGDKCKKCGLRLYEMEKILVDHFCYHKTCFKCTKCGRVLNLGSYLSVDGQPCCKSHSINDAINQSITTVESKIAETDTTQTVDVTITSIKDIKSRYFENVDVKPMIEPTREKQLGYKDSNGNVTRSSLQNICTNANEIQTEHHEQAKKDFIDANYMHMEPQLVCNGTKMEEIPQQQMILPNNSADNNITNQESFSRLNDSEDNFVEIADAFAKFRQLENIQSDQVLPGERKPVRKITPPREEPRFVIDYIEKEPMQNGCVETKIISRKLEPEKVYENLNDPKLHDKFCWSKTEQDQQTFKGQRKQDQIPAKAGNDKPTQQQIVENGEQNRENPKKRESLKEESLGLMEMSELRLTKNMLTKWKEIEQKGLAEKDNKVKPLTTKVFSPQPQSPSAQKTRLNIVQSPLPNENKNEWCFTDNLEVREQRQLLPEQGIIIYYQTSNDPNIEPQSIYLPSLAFTKNGLAKFKELEKKTQNMTASEKRQQRKEFKWGVKETSPLHRPVLLVHHDTTDTSLSHQLRDKRPSTSNEQIMNNVEEQSPLNYMKTTLDQFRLMEDPTKPPPTPELATHQQKTATLNMPRKTFHDIIQVSSSKISN